MTIQPENKRPYQHHKGKTMVDLQKGDGIVLFNGQRMIVESAPFNMGDERRGDDWRISAWTEDRQFRFPIQISAIVEVWRDGSPIAKQLGLFND